MRTRKKTTTDGETSIQQPSINGWDVSYNPDDCRWYVARPLSNGELKFVANYADRRNAMTYARKHQP